MMDRTVKHTGIACGVGKGWQLTVKQELGNHETSMGPGWSSMKLGFSLHARGRLEMVFE